MLMRQAGRMDNKAITVSIMREVDPTRISEATAWVQAGINLAIKYPGFLGSGWVRAGEHSNSWHMLYRFSGEETLVAWENSPERDWWLSSGKQFMQQSRVEKRTGIEGWFDEPTAVTIDVSGEAVGPPPRWKQAISIWLGFFPLNLVFTLLVTWLVPFWTDIGILLRVLITTLILAPTMTFWVLPFVTRLLRNWLVPARL